MALYLRSTAKKRGVVTFWWQGVPFTDVLVRGSISLAFLTSITNPVCRKKSAPIIGLVTAAIKNVWLKIRRNPRLVRMYFVPKTLIAEPFAAETS